MNLLKQNIIKYLWDIETNFRAMKIFKEKNITNYPERRLTLTITVPRYQEALSPIPKPVNNLLKGWLKRTRPGHKK